MKIAFNPSTVAALITPPNNKDITFDLRGRNIFARGVKFCGTDTNTWRDIKINNVSIGSNILDLRNGSNTTLTNTNGVVTINSTWRPVVDNLTSDSTTSSLSANQGRVLAGLINGKSDSNHNHDGRYLRLNGSDTMTGVFKAKANQYNDGYDGAINMNNSDIYGLNSIYTADRSDAQAEGIHFWRDSTHVDTLRMVDGKLLFTPNRPLGGSGTERTVLHTGNSHIKGGIITINGSSLTPLTSLPSHTHSWTSITDKLVAGNEFNIVNAGFNAGMWFNYIPINDRSKTATITGYHFGNGATGYTSINASGFIKKGSNSNYVLLGDGGHKLESSLRVAYASNADMLDGYHATDGRTFTGNINWSGNWNDTWSDGTNKHPWYGFDHRYPNTGAYSTTISDFFGMTIKTANTLRLDFGTLLLNGTSIYSINVASATKLQTARSIWGHSFNGTADINGTIYINNNNSSEGAIRLNNNINSNARISAIDSQVIFNTNAAIRFGGTSWNWNVWAGLKYTHSNKTIYLGLADGSVFNANSALSGGSLRFPGISNVYATTFNGSLSGNASTATTLQTTRTLWGQSFNGSNNVSGNMSGVGLITFSALSGTNGRTLLYLQMADNDFFRIYVGGTASNSGYVEIATADDGNEPIYVRQYTGVFSSVKRTLTLLDANGYTHFPSYINIGGNENNNSSPDRVWGSNSSDSYLRSYRTSALRVAYANSAGSANSATNSRYLTCPDTRSTMPAPTEYTATTTGISFDFKQSSVTGLSGYTGVMTYRPYASGSDWTGGAAHQLGFCGGDNRLYHRTGTSSWSSTWNKLAYITDNVASATNAYHLRINAANTWSTWYWAGLSGQPSWLWGSNDGTNMYVWNPSNFRVAYASSAGNADTVDGVHLSGIFTAFGNNKHNITATIGGVTKEFLVNYASDADKLDGYHATSGNNKPWGTIPAITTSGWMDIGKHLEFHFDNTTGSDYSTILRCTGNYSNIVNLPSAAGTLALTSDIPTSLPANGGNADTTDGVHITWAGELTSTNHLVAWEADGSALRDINPANISVGYASSAGNADKLDGYHASNLLTSVTNTNNGISVTVGGTTKSVSNISVNYASSAGNADTLDGVHLSGIFTSFGNNAHNITATIGGVTKEFRVNYASDADTLDGEHASSFVRAGHYESADLNKLDTYSFIRSVNSQVSSTSPKGNIGWYNVILLVHRNGDDDGPNYIGLIALGMTSNVNDIFFRCRRTDPWKTIIHSNNYTEFINNYYWANVKISTSSSTTTSPTVSNLTATSSIRMGNIYLLNTNEINSTSGIHLNYQNSGNISLCAGGGKVGIGTTSPTYKLDVNGDIHSSGTINCNALNVGSTLSIKDSVISCSAGNISILSKESGSLLINSREVLHYDSDSIDISNKTSFVNRLGLRTGTLGINYSTDDVTVLIGSLSESSYFEFRPAMDGLLLFLKVRKLYSNTYFLCIAKNCEVIKANNFGTYLARNSRKDCFGDGEARIFIYKLITESWYEFYCG